MGIKQLVGLKIRELRLKNKYTQAKLAELVNIAEKHQSCIETGKHYPSADLIEKYAKVFNINPIEIFSIHIKEPKEVLIKRITQKLKRTSYDDIAKIYRMMNW